MFETRGPFVEKQRRILTQGTKCAEHILKKVTELPGNCPMKSNGSILFPEDCPILKETTLPSEDISPANIKNIYI